MKVSALAISPRSLFVRLALLALASRGLRFFLQILDLGLLLSCRSGGRCGRPHQHAKKLAVAILHVLFLGAMSSRRNNKFAPAVDTPGLGLDQPFHDVRWEPSACA